MPWRSQTTPTPSWGLISTLCRTFGAMARQHCTGDTPAQHGQFPTDTLRGKVGMESVELFAWRRLHECAARSQPVGRRAAWTAPDTPGSGAAPAGREGLLGTVPGSWHAFVAPWDSDCLSRKKKQQHPAVFLQGMNPAGWGGDDKAGRFALPKPRLPACRAPPTSRATRPTELMECRRLGRGEETTNQTFVGVSTAAALGTKRAGDQYWARG